MKLARPWETSSKTKRTLEEVQKQCDTCQQVSHAPIRLKVFSPNYNHLKFGEDLSVDLMGLEEKAAFTLLTQQLISRQQHVRFKWRIL